MEFLFNVATMPLIVISLFLVISGISRIRQKNRFEKDSLMTPAVVFGYIYVILGVVFLISSYASLVSFFAYGFWGKTFNISFHLIKIIPVFGALGGLYRYFRYQPRNLILFHVIADVLILLMAWATSGFLDTAASFFAR